MKKVIILGVITVMLVTAELITPTLATAYNEIKIYGKKMNQEWMKEIEKSKSLEEKESKGL